MKEETLTDASLREFLLGKVDEVQRERIESLFLTDSEVRERVLVIEQDLVEDYLEENLTTADKERFVSRYAQTAAQKRKLKITKSIKERAGKDAELTQTLLPKISAWRRFAERLHLGPRFVVLLATMIAIAIVIAVFLLNLRMQQRVRAIEQELAQLNTPTSLREVPLQMRSFDLSPVTARSSGAQIEVKTGSGVQIVQLWLPWIGTERYSKYQAVLSRVGENEAYTIRDLPEEADVRGHAIRVRIPAHILHRGTYLILLSGIAPNGVAGPPEEYSFAVSG